MYPNCAIVRTIILLSEALKNRNMKLARTTGFDPADRNPFSPDFGQKPEYLVGRSRILGQIGAALSAGPRARGFTTLLLGSRGSGKTVLLTEMEDRAVSNGWIVISLDAATAGIEERVRQGIVHARDHYETISDADPDIGRPGRWSGISIGPLALQREVLAEVRPEWDMRHLLSKLAQHAQRAGTCILMTLDEVHSGDREELRRFCADLQHITKRARLPLAFLAAGLSEMKHTLLMDKKMTFFRRCARLDMPDLTEADLLAGLRLPVTSMGGVFEEEALRFAASACGPLPYSMQLVGYNAWSIAGAPERPIDRWTVQESARIAEAQVLEDLIKPAWHDLSESSQSFLVAVSDLGPNATHRELASHLPASPQALAAIEERLKASRYIRETTEGRLQLTDLMPDRAVQELSAAVRRYRTAKAELDSGIQNRAYYPGSEVFRRCRAYMPRAKAFCVLVTGHAGGHRSGRRRRKADT